MTRKEIDKFLANTKVYVNGKSREIQDKLFSIGYKGMDGKTVVSNTGCPFLFIHTNMSFSRSCNMNVFNNHTYKEISAEEILSLELTEPAYRPFKNKEECWNEMLKHEPFGATKHKEKQFYLNWICVGNNGIDGKPFSDAYNDYTFADGTPFGIKEE